MASSQLRRDPRSEGRCSRAELESVELRRGRATLVWSCPSQSTEARRFPWGPPNGARSSLPPAPVHAQLRRAHRRGRWDGAHRGESARAARGASRDEEAARSTPCDERVGSASGAAMERGERCELRSGSALTQLDAPDAEDGRVCCGSPLRPAGAGRRQEERSPRCPQKGPRRRGTRPPRRWWWHVRQERRQPHP